MFFFLNLFSVHFVISDFFMKMHSHAWYYQIVLDTGWHIYNNATESLQTCVLKVVTFHCDVPKVPNPNLIMIFSMFAYCRVYQDYTIMDPTEEDQEGHQGDQDKMLW